MKTLLAIGLIAIAIGLLIPYCHSAETNKAPTILSLSKEPKLSAEVLGAIKYPELKGPATYGAGVDAGYKFNKYVSGHVRLLAYETDNWGGGAIDEGSLLVEARMLSSANRKISLAGVGGFHRDFSADDWGFGVGLKGRATIYKRLSAFAGGEIRAWLNGKPKDALITAGGEFSF